MESAVDLKPRVGDGFLESPDFLRSAALTHAGRTIVAPGQYKQLAGYIRMLKLLYKVIPGRLLFGVKAYAGVGCEGPLSQLSHLLLIALMRLVSTAVGSGMPGLEV